MLHQLGVGGRLLDDGAARRQVAAQHGQATHWVDGGGGGADHVLLEGRGRVVQFLAQRAAGHGHHVQVQVRAQFAQQRQHAAGIVEVFHVVLTRGLQVHQHGGFTADAVQARQVDVDTQAAGDGGQVDDAVGGPANRQQYAQGIFNGLAVDDLVGRQARRGHGDGGGAGAFGHAHAVGGDGRGGRAARHHHAQRFGDAGHGAGRAHHRTGAHAGDQLVVDVGDLGRVDLVGAVAAPVAAAVGAGADPFATVRAGQHRPRDQLNGGHAGGRRAHQLGGHGLVAAADQHHGVHGLRADHFLGVHGHEVAQVHAGGLREALVHRNGREVHGQAARQHDAALDGFDQLRRVAVAGVVAAARVDDADDRTGQGVVGQAGALDERLAQEQRKALVAVVREPARHALRGGAVAIKRAHRGLGALGLVRHFQSR
ncbi:hypothetical protein D3C72_857720 [compost metagenome]